MKMPIQEFREEQDARSAFDAVPLRRWILVSSMGLILYAIHFEGARFLYGPEGWAKVASMALSVSRQELAALMSFGILFSALPRIRIVRGIEFMLLLPFVVMILLEGVGVELLASLGVPLSREMAFVGLRESAGIVTSGVLTRTGAVRISVIGLVLLPLIRFVAPAKPGWLAGRFAMALGIVTALAFVQERPGLDFRFRLLDASLLSPAHAEAAAPDPLAGPPPSLPAETCGPPVPPGAEGVEELRRSRPNVLLVVWESVGGRYLKTFSPFGIARTPALDSLIERGALVFDRAISTSAMSVQSAWTLTFGLAPPIKPFGFTLDIPMPPRGRSIHEAMKDQGYTTAHFNAGKLTMWGFKKIVTTPPPDIFLSGDDLARDAQVSRVGWGVEDSAIYRSARKWINSTASGQRFFGVLWNIETHYPFTWSAMPEEVDNAPDLSRYGAVIERADWMLGRFLAELQALGRLDNTVVIVVGDHGEGMGRFGNPYDIGHGGHVFDDISNVPLIISHPLLKSGNRRVAVPVELADIYPTILDLAGKEEPRVHGVSLLRSLPSRPLIARAITAWPAAVYCGDLKLLMMARDLPARLVDPVRDPGERLDLSSRKAGLAAILTSYLVASQAYGQNDPWSRYGSELFPKMKPEDADGNWRKQR